MAAATKASSTVLALIMIAGLLQSASAVTHTLTWTFAGNATQYDEWSSKQNFAVGDEIAFIYESSEHNVFEVTRADLDSCNLNNPSKTYRESNATVRLDRSGYFGFICGVQGHCTNGNMKMNVDVTGASSPPSSPAPPPSTPTTSPPSTPRPVLSPPTAPPPAPPPSSDASSLETRSALVVGAVVAACAAALF